MGGRGGGRQGSGIDRRPAFDSPLGFSSHTFLPHRAMDFISYLVTRTFIWKSCPPPPHIIPVFPTSRTAGFQKGLLFFLQDWGRDEGPGSTPSHSEGNADSGRDVETQKEGTTPESSRRRTRRSPRPSGQHVPSGRWQETSQHGNGGEREAPGPSIHLFFKISFMYF